MKKQILIIVTLLLILVFNAKSQWLLTGNSPGSTDFLGSTNSNPLNLKTEQSQNINFYTNAGAGTFNHQRMVIRGAGNVGIGDAFTTPQNLLHVHGGELQLTNSTTGSGAGDGLLIGMNGSNAELKQQENAPMLFLVNSSTARMNIATGGNVAIGNGSTAGARILEVKDNMYQLRLTYGTNAYTDMGTNVNAEYVVMPTAAGGGIGRIGLGTASPNTNSFTTIAGNGYTNGLYVTSSTTSGNGITVSETGTSSTGISTLGKTYGIYAVANGTYAFGGSPLAGVYGAADGTNNSGLGTSGNYGMQGAIIAAQPTSDNYGIAGRSETSSSGGTMNNIGVYGIAGNGNNNFGVYGNLAPGTGGVSYSGYFNGAGYLNATAWTYGSDQIIKKNIQPITGALNVITQLQPKSYNYTNEVVKGLNFDTIIHFGLIAQDIQQVLPSLVHKVPVNALMDTLGNVISPATIILGLNYDELIAYLIGSVQELNSKVDDLQSQLDGCCGLRASAPASDGSSGQTIELSSSQLPSLGRSVPNPHAMQATIPYYIPAESGTAQIIFTDELGRTVNTVEIISKGK
ncbi:MAG: tail fiber domain-containing protein, partial [Chitinophagales bacterium]